MAVGSSNSFDLVVLGAGTGGYSAAFRAAQLGMKVALVDEDKIGGTCLHRGCIPTKALLESADFAHRVSTKSRELGVMLPGEVAVDYAVIAARKDQVVRRMWTGLKSLVGKNKVEWVAGRGRLEGPGKVRVTLHGEDGTPGAGGERVLEATDVILATGSRVKSLPGITPDGVRVLTSDDVLRLSELPASMVIIGAGAVGCEFASCFHDLGVKVTLLEYLPAIVPLEDRDVSKELEKSFKRRGIEVVTNARFDAALAGRRGGRDPPDRRAARAARRRRSPPRSCWSPPGARPTSRTWGSRRPAWRRTAGSSWSTATCAPPSRTSGRSATSWAGSGWPTPPRTRG